MDPARELIRICAVTFRTRAEFHIGGVFNIGQYAADMLATLALVVGMQRRAQIAVIYWTQLFCAVVDYSRRLARAV